MRHLFWTVETRDGKIVLIIELFFWFFSQKNQFSRNLFSCETIQFFNWQYQNVQLIRSSRNHKSGEISGLATLGENQILLQQFSLIENFSFSKLLIVCSK